jgi:CBS domain containing-hemolysin-like protein
MDSIPLGSLGIALAVLLVTSGFFSIAETAMMAVNRYRLRHRAHHGERGAKLAVALLGKTDTLLGVILLGNNLINAGAATPPSSDPAQASEFALAGNGVTCVCVLGHARGGGAPAASFRRRLPARLLLRATPVVGFINLFVRAAQACASGERGRRR